MLQVQLIKTSRLLPTYCYRSDLKNNGFEASGGLASVAAGLEHVPEASGVAEVGIFTRTEFGI